MSDTMLIQLDADLTQVFARAAADAAATKVRERRASRQGWQWDGRELESKSWREERAEQQQQQQALLAELMRLPENQRFKVYP